MLFITNREMRNCPSLSCPHVPYINFDAGNNNISHNLIYGHNEWVADVELPFPDYKYYYETGSPQFMQKLKECKAKHILFYIHGFDTLPNEVFKNAMKLQEMLDAKEKDLVKIVPVIWPGDDTTLEYWHAQKSADASAFGFHRALSKLASWATNQPKDDPCRKRLHVLAHSMGARVLRESLIAYKKYDCPQGLPALFKNIFLVAPDLVNETLEYGKSGHVITECTKNVQVSYAYSDIALKGSKIANLRGRRLGHSGVENIKNIPPNVTQVDCDSFNFLEDPIYGHTYFLCETVIAHLYDSILH